MCVCVCARACMLGALSCASVYDKEGERLQRQMHREESQRTRDSLKVRGCQKAAWIGNVCSRSRNRVLCVERPEETRNLSAMPNGLFTNTFRSAEPSLLPIFTPVVPVINRDS